MEPTYSVTEIKRLLPDLEVADIDLLTEVCEDEKNLYTACELKAIDKMVTIAKKNLAANALQIEYLLSFN